MNILHIIDVKNRECSGVGQVVPQYLKYQSKYCNIGLYDLNNIEPKNNECYKTFLYKDYGSIIEIIKIWNKIDLVVFHEIYKPKYIKLYKECKRLNIPYVIIPHGSLVYKEQHRKYLKKLIGNLVFFNSYIQNATAIQFLNEQEKDNTKFKIKKSIVSGNGVDLNKNNVNFPKKFKFIYIGRYSIYTKGLDLLVSACKELKQWILDNEIEVSLFGTSSEKEVNKLKKIIKENELDKIIEINNPIYNENKIKTLCNSSCFIQLSRHEAQPMTILEALSVGLPCLVTYNTSFGKCLNENKCGIGTSTKIEDIKEAIVKMYENRGNLKEYSKNAKIVIEKDYNWDTITKDLLNKYMELVKVIVNC